MTDQTIQGIILDEVRAMRTKLDMHSVEASERLTALETHMYTLIGNGQPGRLTMLETGITAVRTEVSEIQHWRSRVKGGYIAVSAVVAGAVSIIYHIWK